MTEHENIPLTRGTRVPLFFLLLAVVLAVAVLPLALFGGLTVGVMRDTLVSAQQERQLRQTAALAQRFDALVEQSQREAVKLGEALGRSVADPNGPRLLLPGFLDRAVLMARFLPTSGPALQAVSPRLLLPAGIEKGLNEEVSGLLARAALDADDKTRLAQVAGPFVVGPENLHLIAITAAVRGSGEIIGAYQEVVLFDELWADALQSAPPPTRLFLISPQGEIVARSRAEVAETDTSLRRREIVQQWLGSRGRQSGTRSYAVTRGAGAEERALGSIASTALGWGLFAEVDESLALAPVKALFRQVIVSGVLAVLLAAGAALLLGGRISRPMRRLAAISKRIADGDFSVRAEPSHVAELDILGQNFNFMSSKLGELIERFRVAAREVNDMFLGTIRAMAEAIDEKDPYTKGHSVRVSRYSVIIGRYLGLTPEEMRNLHVSSLLHDVGKIGIDDMILKKPAALTPEEFEVMKTHPERGARIMSRIPQMRNMIHGIRFHHERWRGGGYPQGLKGDEIPLQARIIAVADTFDAMTTDRPYQRAFTVPDAVARINDLKAVLFAPECVEAFNRAFEAGEFDEVLSTRPGFFPPAELQTSGPQSTAVKSST